MRIRRALIWICALAAALLPLAGCAPLVEDEAQQIVYASFYPIYALSEMIVHDVPNLELRQLIQPQDGCLRSYALSDWDLYQLAYNADAVLLGGRGLEQFEGALSNLGADGPAVATIFQGIQLEGESASASSFDEDASHLEGENPHVYLSARALPDILETICACMTALDPAYSSVYEQNLTEALEQAEALIAVCDEARDEIDHDIPVALFNEALIYPALDLDIRVECRIGRESGASFDEAEWDGVWKQLKSRDIRVALVEKQAPDALVAKLEGQGISVVRLDILSSGRQEMGSEGYFEAMRVNFAALRKALAAE